MLSTISEFNHGLLKLNKSILTEQLLHTNFGYLMSHFTKLFKIYFLIHTIIIEFLTHVRIVDILIMILIYIISKHWVV